MNSLSSSSPLTSYIVIANISKAANVKQLIQVATAYNFRAIVVGMNRIVHEKDIVDYDCIRMADLNEVKAFLQAENIKLIAIEIAASAKSLATYAFPSRLALMPGNEGTGLNERQREVADEFVYIPQFGSGIESLNVTVATTIVLHECVSQLGLLQPAR